jgi:hypothetical protein
MTLENALIRCFRCDYLNDNTMSCMFRHSAIEEITDCDMFTCPEDCICTAQPNEPLPCEVGPEELIALIEEHKNKKKL